MAGTITTSTIQNDTSSPPTFRNNSVEIGTLCRAWVNFNGTGTPAIRASFNVSSITDNDTGDYTINFTTAMPDANYSVAGSTGGTTGAFLWRTYDEATARTSSLFRISTINLSASQIDPVQVNLSVFR
jgi:hypothetical protein